MKRTIVAFLFTCLTVLAHSADETDFFAKLSTLPDADQFRQLTLMLLISQGADADLMKMMRQRSEAWGFAAGDDMSFNLDDYTTPLIRIVDQKTMLAGASRLFEFTRENVDAISSRLADIRDSNDEAVLESRLPAIREDAIIIRNAIADSIDFSEAESGGEPGGTSESYRARTVFLRNNLEYDLFSAELDRMTQDAIASVGGRTEAFERMFDDEIDSASLNKKIDAAEYVYGWDRDFDERAAKLAEEILGRIWDEESDLNP